MTLKGLSGLSAELSEGKEWLMKPLKMSHLNLQKKCGVVMFSTWQLTALPEASTTDLTVAGMFLKRLLHFRPVVFTRFFKNTLQLTTSKRKSNSFVKRTAWIRIFAPTNCSVLQQYLTNLIYN